MKSVLFVCLGNICRSALAESAMNLIVKDNGAESEWLIDSCGTASYHIGERPDSRARATMKKHGLTTQHKARQLCTEDFHQFDVIFGMDDNNIRDIERVKPKGSKARIELLGDYDPQNIKIIEDPYYGGDDGFEVVYEQCMRCCKAFYQQTSKS
ncbi:ACP1 [Bugula neritina]|uniref:Low molecular weight phosphotyrosine protein phosphatase n=1 Tax=Bugula neritina TaxID=10212 RepID=A0A7J7ISV6_BUGNE|nr:ACP1 [Bugula neritina]